MGVVQEEMKPRGVYKADHIMHRTCQWSMKLKSHFIVSYDTKDTSEQSEGWHENGKRDSTTQQ